MASIDIDFDVYKALTVLRADESDTYNDVLRRLLGLSVADRVAASPPSWVWKGVALPEGTELKAEYKGKVYHAEILNGSWSQGGKVFSSPSAGAYEITGSATNGWAFWHAKRPNEAGWTPLSKLRGS